MQGTRLTLLGDLTLQHITNLPHFVDSTVIELERKMAGVNGNGDRANCGNSRFKSVLASTFYVYVTCREKSDFISAVQCTARLGRGGGSERKRKKLLRDHNFPARTG